ncbi:MAG: hypothetical protein NTX84_01655 [Nitrospirae bacterium]|nr:hypothetical protein [Nitrospirota bacterium]
MSLRETREQTTHEAPAAPRSESYSSPTLLTVCCTCGLVRDETGSSPGPERWGTKQTYREISGLNQADFPLTHAYCPACFTKVQEAVRQYLREIGKGP